MTTYSATGSKQFNLYIDKTLKELADEIEKAMKDSFLALILAGGYGRGEGACVIRDGKESAYNDFDLFVVVKDPLTLSSEVERITKAYEQRLGIEVDIGKPLTLSSIQQFPHQLMWQDLLESHHVIKGDPNILINNAPSSLNAPLPQVEALRLLLNRGSGLLQAIIQSYTLTVNSKHILPDTDFIRRNKEKCTLALGDSLLITHSLYTPPLAMRTKVLREHTATIQLEHIQRIIDLYERAAQFKTQPDSLEKEQPSLSHLKDIATLFIEVVLYCERERTGKKWGTPHEYASDSFIREKEQHTPKALLRNLIKNMKSKKLSPFYPREKLYGELLLLLEKPQPESDKWRKRGSEFLKIWNECN